MLFSVAMSDLKTQEQGLGFWDVVDSTLTYAGAGLTALDTFGGDKLGGAVPLLGSAIDAYGLAGGLMGMGGAFSGDGKGLHDDEFYDGAGAVVNNGMSLGMTGLAAGFTAAGAGAGGLVGSIFGPLGTMVGGAGGAMAAAGMVEGANTVIGAGMAAADMAGQATKYAGGDDAEFSADSITGGLLRGTLGDESLGWSAGSAVSNTLGGGVGADVVGGIAGTALNLAALPLNLADTAIGGAVNFGADLYDDDSEESTLWSSVKSAVNPFAGMYD